MEYRIKSNSRERSVLSRAYSPASDSLLTRAYRWAERNAGKAALATTLIAAPVFSTGCGSSQQQSKPAAVVMSPAERARVATHQKMTEVIKRKYGENLANAYREGVRKGEIVYSMPDSKADNVFIYRNGEILGRYKLGSDKMPFGDPDLEEWDFYLKFRGGNVVSQAGKKAGEKIEEYEQGAKDASQRYKGEKSEKKYDRRDLRDSW